MGPPSTHTIQLNPIKVKKKKTNKVPEAGGEVKRKMSKFAQQEFSCGQRDKQL